jgi:hypothetical protein
MSIYVPINIKAKMDKVKEPVNWSALACRAFEDKLAEIASRKENKTMSDVVQRLRATLRKQKSVDYQVGYGVGRAWAERVADVAELFRLDKLRRECPNEYARDWSKGWQSLFDDNVDMRLKIAETIKGQKLDIAEMRDFWDQTLDDYDTVSGDHVHGFADGALALWDSVKDEVEKDS